MRYLFFLSFRVNRSRLNRRLRNKTVLITGASYGIGERLATTLGFAGCRLVLVARSQDRLRTVQTQVERAGAEATSFACDLTEPSEVDDLVVYLESIGGVDIVVSNAGRSIHRSVFASLDRHHDVRRTMDINFFGPTQLILRLIPMLLERRGQIVNVSAVNVLLVPAPKWAAYQGSKTAFDQWFRSVGAELRPRGIQTTSVYLPLVRTRMIEPTRAYDNVPALQPNDAAALICRAIISGRPKVGPWWLLAAELGSVVLRSPLEYAATHLPKRDRSAFSIQSERLSYD